MKKPIATLYLFNNIFYPQTVIPLSVSDATSKAMLLSCFEKNETIALYFPKTHSKNIGTLGKILMIDHNTDGSLSVAVQGLVRVRLLGIHSEEPFPKYFVDDYFDHEEKAQTLTDSPLERLYHVLEFWLNRHVHSKKERERFMKDISSPVKLINNLCMLMIKDIELKQIFLESTSLLDRVRMMNALLIGESPEMENFEMCEAIKNFERLGHGSDEYNNAS
jgi:Lon protease-like protein